MEGWVYVRDVLDLGRVGDTIVGGLQDNKDCMVGDAAGTTSLAFDNEAAPSFWVSLLRNAMLTADDVDCFAFLACVALECGVVERHPRYFYFRILSMSPRLRRVLKSTMPFPA